MLLNRVSLQGFLAHRGQEADGVLAPIEMDFRDSNLWLMHGANGSGKSSVFDAITFALFDKARGSQLLQLVNDRSERARVEVEFEANGERYLVRRQIKLSKRRDKHTMSSEVLRWNAESQIFEVENGVGKIGEWAEKTLQVSYRNFVSAVVLEQGRADQFLRAAPRARREQLMELLDLKVYEELSNATNTRRTAARRVFDDKAKQLANATLVSPAEVEAASAAVEAAQTRVAAAHDNLNGAQKRWEDAQLAAAKIAEIAKKAAQLQGDVALTEQAEQIEAAAARRDEIGAILPALNALRNARLAMANAKREQEMACQTLIEARDKAGALEPEIERARAQSEVADRAALEAKSRAQESEIHNKNAAREAEVAAQIESWEAKLRKCEGELAPHQSWLERAESIEAARQKWEHLSAVFQKIKPLQAAKARLQSAREGEAQAEMAHQQALALLQSEDAPTGEARVAIESALEEARAEQSKVGARLEVRRELWHSRETLGDADECPTCGTTLDDSDACERLQQEREILRREVEQLQAREAELSDETKRLQGKRAEAMRAEKAAEKRRDDAAKVAHKTEAQWEAARRDLTEKTRDWQERHDEAGAWANEDYLAVQAHLNALDGARIAADFSALQDAQKIAAQNQVRVESCREQLENLPAWDDEKRRQIKDLERDAERAYAAALAELQTAQRLAGEARARFDDARKSWDAANNQVAVAVEIEAVKTAANDNAQRELDAQFAQLAPQWSEHRAARDDGVLDELKREWDKLQPLAARLNELRAAQQRVSNLHSVIALLQSQLDAIPAQNRVEPALAQSALEEARAVAQSEESGLQLAKDSWASAARLRETWERHEAERDAAQTEFSRYQDLAEAFGRDGLQAKIIRQAQENLRGAANGILGRLSNGQWQLDLRGEDDSELEIIARDEGRGGYERAFDALSGGERFRVAISLAIAIGQMASGGAPMNTLVIDEGFGALDEENRGLMVDNLRHLSEHELKNGRIIVVSHQDDVRDAFGHRYQFSRDAGGYARVEMTLG